VLAQTLILSTVIDTSCTDSKFVGKDYVVEVDLKEDGETPMETSVELLSNIARCVNMSWLKWLVSTEMNEAGRFERIYVYVDSRSIADDLTDAIKLLQNDTDCDCGLICMVKKVKYYYDPTAPDDDDVASMSFEKLWLFVVSLIISLSTIFH